MVKRIRRNSMNRRGALVPIDHGQLDRLASLLEKELPDGLKVTTTAQVRMALERFLKAQGA